MKKFTISFFIALLVIGFSANATVHTVSNNQNSPGQFTSLQAAIDAASPGDTIYVSGSTSNYGSVTVSKQLTLIGAGYNPNNQFQFKTQLSTITLSMGTTTNPSGTLIMGFDLSGISCNSNNINNITITLNRIGTIGLGSRTINNWVIKNNILNYVSSGSNSTNILVFNNFITQYLSGFNSTSVVVSNNIFLRNSPSSNIFASVEYAVVTNNIVWGLSTGGCNYCTFNNNISFGGNQTSFIYNNNTGQNNFENVNPLFVNAPDFVFNYNHNYLLAAGSPGVGAGTDGTNIGIYGGAFPFPSGGPIPYQTSPVPPIPQVVSMNILNSVLPENGTLQVEVEGKSQF